MAEGHIRLGVTAATLRDYLLVEPRQYRATSANPMAARVSTGSQYGDLQAWSTFLMADWQAGGGKVAAEAGGFLFGEAETRVPQQIILPAALGCSQMNLITGATNEQCAYLPSAAGAVSAVNIGGTGNPTRLSFSISVYGDATLGWRPEISGVAFYGYAPDGVGLTAALYDNSSGQPGTQVASGTATAATYRPGYQWYWIPLSAVYNPASINGNVTFHWVIYPTSNSNTITFAQGDAYGGGSYTYDGATWSANSGDPFFVYKRPWPNTSVYGTRRHAGIRGLFIDTSTDEVCAFTAHQSLTTDELVSAPLCLRYNSTTDLWQYTQTTGVVQFSGVTPDDVGGPTLYDGVVYIPQGSQYSTWTLSGNTGGTSTNDAHLFCSWAGYLWRAYNNQLWYSTDGSTWTAIANDVGPSDYRIRGMAGLGQYLYVATDEALYYVAPGDVAVGLFPWSTIDEGNGVGMVVHQGALYIPVAGRILRYSEDGSLQDVWVNRDDDLNNRRLGKITALAGLSSWLVAGVNGTTSSDPASVWAFTQQGWHHMATLPPSFQIRSLYYDRVRSRLWIASDEWAIFYVHAPDWALNPYNDSNSTYMPHGWMEIGRVYGGLRELRKDWESVRTFGEFTATGQELTVYWQDAGTPSWTSLGTVTEDAQELRWSDYSTRPAGRWLRLGFLLATDDPTETPKVEAVATKLLPMVTDREAWNLSIAISDDQEMVDGEINPYTASEMIAHLRGLVQQVPPFIFEDVDGTQYEVKVVGAARSLQQFEYLPGGTKLQYVYALTLEQVTADVYAV